MEMILQESNTLSGFRNIWLYGHGQHNSENFSPSPLSNRLVDTKLGSQYQAYEMINATLGSGYAQFFILIYRSNSATHLSRKKKITQLLCRLSSPHPEGTTTTMDFAATSLNKNNGSSLLPRNNGNDDEGFGALDWHLSLELFDGSSHPKVVPTLWSCDPIHWFWEIIEWLLKTSSSLVSGPCDS